MSPVIAVSFVGIIIVLVIVLLVAQRRRERERTEALRRVAETAGLTFEPRGELESLRSRGDLQLFAHGHSKRATNVMTGRLDDQEVIVFDYRFTTGSGKHQHTTTETIVMLPGANHALPDLRMAPESPLTKVWEAFGYQDIDIDSSPEFSRQYVLKGANEEAIRTALYPKATSYFGEHAGWTVEIRSGTIAVYRGARRPKAEDMRPFIDEALAAARSL